MTEHDPPPPASRGGLPQTLVAALERAAATEHGVGFLDRRERLIEMSWRDILVRARRAAGGLQALGVAAGDRVGLVYPTGAEFFCAFFGALAAGAIPVPLYPPVRLGRVREYGERTSSLLARVGTRVLLAEGRTRRLLERASSDADLGIECRTLDELRGAACDPRVASPEEIALVQFSSGTTADPKPVALSHRALLAQVERLNAFWPESEDERHAGVSWLPLYHDMGLVGCVFVALTRLGPLTLLPPELFVARPAAWLRAVSRCRATISPAPTFAYAQCVERVRDSELEGVDLSSWRFALCGAETVVPRVLRRFAARFAPWGFRAEALTPVYGLAEAALAVTFPEPSRGLRTRCFSPATLAAGRRAVEGDGGRELAALGKPLPGFSIEARSDERRPCSEGVVGRIWVTGPSLMDGYFADREATRRTIVNGWLDTGDLGLLLDGELYLTGRAKDVLILRGRNFAPDEIERAVVGVRGVRPGGAVAVSHQGAGRDGEELLVFVERRRGAAVSTELGERCRRAVLAATGLAAREVVVLDPGTVPRTSSGKVRRAETLRRYLSGELGAAPPGSPGA